jgi:uncharacterized protein YecT (DUF1311 family)
MKYTKFILLLALLVYIPNTTKADDCNYDGTQLEMTSCAAENHDKVDKILNKIYQEKMRSLSKSKHDALRKQQRKWLKQTKYDCEAETDEIYSRGGSGWPMKYWMCITESTKKRIDELNEIK